jgi:hypothetical protein
MFEEMAGTGLTGATLVDERSDKVGTITDVLVDDTTLEPRWAVVRYGMLRHQALVPVGELYPAKDGAVVTRLDRELVHNAPRFHGDLPDTSEAEHYYHRS